MRYNFSLQVTLTGHMNMCAIFSNVLLVNWFMYHSYVSSGGANDSWIRPKRTALSPFLHFWHLYFFFPLSSNAQCRAAMRTNTSACKSFPHHDPHFIMALCDVNKQYDSLITQSMSSCITCLLFSITLATNCHRFLPYYQDSYFGGEKNPKQNRNKLKDDLTFFDTGI